jgi:hypothetical protein
MKRYKIQLSIDIEDILQEAYFDVNAKKVLVLVFSVPIETVVEPED